MESSAPLFHMITPKEILLALAAPALAGALSFVFTLPKTDIHPREAAQTNVRSDVDLARPDSRSTSGEQNSDKPLVSSTTVGSAISSDLSYKVYPSREAAIEEIGSRQRLQFQAEDYNVYQIPLVFMNHGNAVLATEEVAAAVQNIQRDFVDSTGAGTSDPEDPDYAARWELAQPTADDIFHAIAGDEAYSAMWAARVKQLGHF